MPNIGEERALETEQDSVTAGDAHTSSFTIGSSFVDLQTVPKKPITVSDKLSGSIVPPQEVSLPGQAELPSSSGDGQDAMRLMGSSPVVQVSPHGSMSHQSLFALPSFRQAAGVAVTQSMDGS